MRGRLNVLLAEDNEDDVLLLKRAMRAAGIRTPVHVCRDGQEVIDYLAAKGPYEDRQMYPFPNALFLDIKMPKVSGLEVLDWLKSRPECSVVPTIILTSSRQESDIKQAYMAGANAYLVKPPTLGELQRMMKATFEFWDLCEAPPLPERCT